MEDEMKIYHTHDDNSKDEITPGRNSLSAMSLPGQPHKRKKYGLD
jgi:hypothetical protein